MRLVSPRVPRLAAVAIALLFAATAVHAQDPAGHWRGTWTDFKSGHHGPLKATITKCDDTHYRAVFVGRFFGILPFRFDAALTVTGVDGDAVLMSGSSNLGLFGTFTYSARVTSSCFIADFCSRRYTGRFTMERDCATCGHH